MEHDPDKPESAMEHENHDMKARIITLEHNEVKPFVAKMVYAREQKGASPELIAEFTKSLDGKTSKEIKALYANEEILIETLSATEKPESELKHFSWGQTGEQLSAKSMDEIFNEEVAA